jgi:hypothetical protein
LIHPNVQNSTITTLPRSSAQLSGGLLIHVSDAIVGASGPSGRVSGVTDGSAVGVAGALVGVAVAMGRVAATVTDSAVGAKVAGAGGMLVAVAGGAVVGVWDGRF